MTATAIATAISPTAIPATVVLDPLFRDVLRLEDLRVRPLQLPCAGCGRTFCCPRRTPAGLQGFLRPGLPLGYVYVDQLRLGDAFRFISRGSDADVRVAAHQPFALDEETGLMQVQSSMRVARLTWCTWSRRTPSCVATCRRPDMTSAGFPRT